MRTPSGMPKAGPPIDLVTHRAVAEPTTGGYRSLFKGQGTAFSELRAYEPGDDVRNIDWNVTARSGEPWVRVYEEERELTVFLVVDRSSSTGYGSHAGLKSQQIARVAATLIRSAQRAGDRVGLITFSDRVLSVLPPRKGKAHATRLLSALSTPIEPFAGTDLRGALKRLLEVRRRTAMVFVLSDFAAPDYADTLRAASGRFDLVPIVITDRAEAELPDDGLVRLRDSESGQELVVDSSSREVRDAWRTHAQRTQAQRARLFRQLRMSAVETEVSEDPVRALSLLMARRASGRHP